jgi:hypothetical protein
MVFNANFHSISATLFYWGRTHTVVLSTPVYVEILEHPVYERYVK